MIWSWWKWNLMNITFWCNNYCLLQFAQCFLKTCDMHLKLFFLMQLLKCPSMLLSWMTYIIILQQHCACWWSFFLSHFFDLMIHLIMHLVREVRLCRTIHFKWMYPIERYIKILKIYVENRSRRERYAKG